MMEMDGRDKAKCRKSKLGDIDGIIEFVLNDNNTKLEIVTPRPDEVRSIYNCRGTYVHQVSL